MNELSNYKNKQRKKKDIQRILQHVISVILSFFLSLGMVTLMILLVFELTCYHKSNLQRILLSSGYYEAVQQDLYDAAEEFIFPTGLPFEVLNGAFPLSQIYQDINGHIFSTLDGKTYEADTAIIAQRLNTKIRKEETLRDRILNEDQEQNISYLLQGISDEYEKGVKPTIFTVLMSRREEFRNFLFKGFVFIGAGMLIFSVLLFRINTWVHRALRYLTYSLEAAALMVIVAPGYWLFKGKDFVVNVASYSTQQLINAFLMNILKMFVNIGIYVGIVSLLCMVLAIQKKRALLKTN